MVKKKFMSEGEMAFMLAFQLLESVGKLTKLFEQLAKRPTVVYNYYYGIHKEDPNPSMSDDDPQDTELIEKLKPIFYNNEENVRRFLTEIRGMSTEGITDLVNKWVNDRLISNYGNSRKGELWGILHKAKLYSKTKSNWNGRVK
jgi:hypothetical protein